MGGGRGGLSRSQQVGGLGTYPGGGHGGGGSSVVQQQGQEMGREGGSGLVPPTPSGCWSYWDNTSPLLGWAGGKFGGC